MTTFVRPGPEFAELFRQFERSAWRWEAQGTYREPGEAEAWQRWRAGQPDDLAWLKPWLREIAAATAAGRRFARVRVQTDPPTEYLRWQAVITPNNIEAGEEIRVLGEHRARDLGLPKHDFWIFDDVRLAVLRFGAAGLEGAEIITEPGVVARHRAWRDLAWSNAAPFDTRDDE
ncbi:DUF6879 family protein [Actinosynnema sp. CA-248983]